jgi:hypothetical protein
MLPLCVDRMARHVHVALARTLDGSFLSTPAGRPSRARGAKISRQVTSSFLRSRTAVRVGQDAVSAGGMGTEERGSGELAGRSAVRTRAIHMSPTQREPLLLPCVIKCGSLAWAPPRLRSRVGCTDDSRSRIHPWTKKDGVGVAQFRSSGCMHPSRQLGRVFALRRVPQASSLAVAEAFSAGLDWHASK